jgi:hypothetical protein
VTVVGVGEAQPELENSATAMNVSERTARNNVGERDDNPELCCFSSCNCRPHCHVTEGGTGAPGGIRTHDPRFRRPMLLSAELQARVRRYSTRVVIQHAKTALVGVQGQSQRGCCPTDCLATEQATDNPPRV